MKRYTSLDNMTAPSVDDLAGEAECGRDAVRSVVEVLRSTESAVAQSENNRGHLTGDVEVDEHGVRSFHISTKNEFYKKYITKKLAAGGHTYYLNYVRVIGLRKRGGGRVILKMLPPKPLPPGSRPPPLSDAELLESRVLRRVHLKACVIHSDGAQAYPSIIRKHFKGLKARAVSHKNMEFVKGVPAVNLGKHWKSSTLTGTQSIDATWGTLDACIPSQLRTKVGNKMNPLLEEYIWSWVYRVNHRNVDGFQTLGRYLQKTC